MTLLEFFMKTTGKKADEVTPQEYDALIIAEEHFRMRLEDLKGNLIRVTN